MTTSPSPVGDHLPDVPGPGDSPNACLLASAVERGSGVRARFGNSIIGSALTHIVGFVVTLFVVGKVPVTPRSTDTVDDKASEIVWVSIPGPGRRGDDGGDGKPEPPRQAERSRTDSRSVATAPNLAHEPLKDVPRSDTEIDIPPVNASIGVVELPGALIGLPTLRSQGREMGRGAGIGSGARGLGGTGNEGGAGDEAVGPGNGVTMPTVLREVKPSYTADAMRAKVQGAVMVQAIVREDGSVGQVRVIRSLDRTFGLDEEALKAVRNWRFSPGKRLGRNVAVLVEIELTFTLR